MRMQTGSTAAVFVAAMLGWAGLAEAAPLPRVWVTPFTDADESRQPDWVSRAMNQALADELASLRGVDVVDGRTAPLAGAGGQTLAEQAKAHGADLVVSGTIQRAGGELRVTGRVQEASTGNNLGAFKATGSDREIFAIEDSVAQQVKEIVAPRAAAPATAVALAAPTQPSGPTTTTTPAAPAAPGAPPLTIQTPFAPGQWGFEGSDLQRSMRDPGYIRRGADRTYVPYQAQPAYPLYPYTYGLNGYSSYGYGYGYPYWNSGYNVVIIGGRWGRGGHHHGGGWHGGGGGGGGGGWHQPSVPSNNGQAIRHAASWAGNPPSIVTHTMSPGTPQLVPGPAVRGRR